MGSEGDPYDNAPCQSFRTLRVRITRSTRFKSQAENGMTVSLYNQFDYQSPVNYERMPSLLLDARDCDGSSEPGQLHYPDFELSSIAFEHRLGKALTDPGSSAT